MGNNMDLKKGYCFLNGKILREADADININDTGFLRGYGVFDFIRTYNGKPFLLKEHLNRLRRSAKKLNITMPYSHSELGDVIQKLISKNKYKESTIRIVLTGGITEDGFFPIDVLSPTVLLTIKPLNYNQSELSGVSLITQKYLRDLPEIKTLNYANLLKSQEILNKKKAYSLLYTYDGYVLEAAISNIFLIKKNRLITPSKNILLGITRNLIIKLFSKDFKFEEREVLVKELYESDEIVLSGTKQGVIPVTQIDGSKISNGVIGERTKLMISKFNQFAHAS